ncbi:hypothetical protein AK812_SmicGene25139 [Symbiodinium microadriaticum]|uniref:Uncharacterized protein n=1 Tax=Symbiodinium microadriaticum TaxID=2951 RepID=A0A1Q9DD41_SYMMI|nr:hypothetical protein AK812_SmicGene25139 [Symbiodinium microadriaticum]
MLLKLLLLCSSMLCFPLSVLLLLPLQIWLLLLSFFLLLLLPPLLLLSLLMLLISDVGVAIAVVAAVAALVESAGARAVAADIAAAGAAVLDVVVVVVVVAAAAAAAVSAVSADAAAAAVSAVSADALLLALVLLMLLVVAAEQLPAASTTAGAVAAAVGGAGAVAAEMGMGVYVCWSPINEDTSHVQCKRTCGQFLDAVGFEMGLTQLNEVEVSRGDVKVTMKCFDSSVISDLVPAVKQIVDMLDEPATDSGNRRLHALSGGASGTQHACLLRDTDSHHGGVDGNPGWLRVQYSHDGEDDLALYFRVIKVFYSDSSLMRCIKHGAEYKLDGGYFVPVSLRGLLFKDIRIHELGLRDVRYHWGHVYTICLELRSMIIDDPYRPRNALEMQWESLQHCKSQLYNQTTTLRLSVCLPAYLEVLSDLSLTAPNIMTLLEEISPVVMLVAHGKPTYFEMFRSRGDAIFASQLLKAIKDHSAVDINAILVQLNGGPLDLSDWKSRQTLIKNLIDKIVTFMQTLMPADPSVDMMKRLEALERENAALKANATGQPSEPEPAVPNPAETPSGSPGQLATSGERGGKPPPSPGVIPAMFRSSANATSKPLGKFTCGSSKPVFEDNAPTSATGQSIAPWLKKQFDTNKKMKNFDVINREVEEAYNQLDAGNQPQLDRLLVGWGLDVQLAAKLTHANALKLLAAAHALRE